MKYDNILEQQCGVCGVTFSVGDNFTTQVVPGEGETESYTREIHPECVTGDVDAIERGIKKGVIMTITE